MMIWPTLLKTLGAKPDKFMIWLFQLLAVVTLTCKEWVSWVALEVERARVALVPLQVPFSVKLSHPLRRTGQPKGVGEGVGVKLLVGVKVLVKVAVGRVPVGVAVAVGVKVDVARGLLVGVGVKVLKAWFIVTS